MPAVVAVRGAETINTDQVIIAMDRAVRLILPQAAPMITMLMKASKKSVSNATFKHMEEEPFPRSFTFTGACAVAGTSATVNSTVATWFAVATSADTSAGGVNVFIPKSKEIIWVTAESAGTITFVKGRGGTTDTAIAVGDEGIIMGSANREDSDAPEPISVKKATKTFYCQMWRDALEITHTAVGTEMYHGNDRTWTQRVKLIKHKMDLEYALLLNGSGETYDVDSDSLEVKFASGALGMITGTNVIDCGGNLTRPLLWDALRRAGEYHFGDWLCAGSPLFMSIVNGWAHDAIRPSAPVLRDTYGVNLSDLETPEGTLHLAKEKILKGTTLQKYAFIFPMPIENHIRWRPFKGSGIDKDTKLYQNIKTENNPQVFKDEYLTQGGFEWHEVSKMLILKNIG